ncbi:uncharacterized protein LOC113509424 [Galleria mellonella]|uniref:Uncharacterized protein LOC113509424 n=1 Tax=Galleria mellonella TaxID=7137 RepID=A0ABM3MN78_GALME|nr:uncharacterized protein LOC113509424 [Galleria mellonella]
MRPKNLPKYIEIYNLPFHDDENVDELVQKVAEKLNLQTDGIKNSRRLKGREDRVGNIEVVLNGKNIQEQWIAMAKNTSITVTDIMPEENNKKVVYVREKMSLLNKAILWHAKQELKIKHNYKYVWFKKGVVKACKEDNGKVYYLKTLEDVYRLSQKTTV